MEATASLTAIEECVLHAYSDLLDRTARVATAIESGAPFYGLSRCEELIDAASKLEELFARAHAERMPLRQMPVPRTLDAPARPLRQRLADQARTSERITGLAAVRS